MAFASSVGANSAAAEVAGRFSTKEVGCVKSTAGGSSVEYAMVGCTTQGTTS